MSSSQPCRIVRPHYEPSIRKSTCLQHDNFSHGQRDCVWSYTDYRHATRVAWLLWCFPTIKLDTGEALCYLFTCSESNMMMEVSVSGSTEKNAYDLLEFSVVILLALAIDSTSGAYVYKALTFLLRVDSSLNTTNVTFLTF
ncbi:hypothetical protein TNCV_2748691 [Trichonephila clavipes]|nr:hypothetical protein TNCV_2748691 [Trichonephila clavipes]